MTAIEAELLAKRLDAVADKIMPIQWALARLSADLQDDWITKERIKLAVEQLGLVRAALANEALSLQTWKRPEESFDELGLEPIVEG